VVVISINSCYPPLAGRVKGCYGILFFTVSLRKLSLPYHRVWKHRGFVEDGLAVLEEVWLH
jgi:hypothetical protein